MSSETLLPSDTAAALALGKITDVAEAGIVSRTLLKSDDLRIVHFIFAPGQELTSHTSRHRAIVQVLDGACEFFFADAWHRLEAGSLLHMPPNHPHAVRAPFGTFAMILTLAT